MSRADIRFLFISGSPEGTVFETEQIVGSPPVLAATRMLDGGRPFQLAQCLSRPTATENLRTRVRIFYRIYSGKVQLWERASW